jgi:hypothetical protein
MFVNLYVAIAAPIYAAIATRSLETAFIVIGSVILVVGVFLRGMCRKAYSIATGD